MAGIKHDNGKSCLSMVPVELLNHTASTLMYGAKKYGKNNYKEGMKYSRLLDAALRHIYEYANKKDLDEESGLNHLGHAAANIGMLLYYIENNVGEDDR